MRRVGHLIEGIDGVIVVAGDHVKRYVERLRVIRLLKHGLKIAALELFDAVNSRYLKPLIVRACGAIIIDLKRNLPLMRPNRPQLCTLSPTFATKSKPSCAASRAIDAASRVCMSVTRPLWPEIGRVEGY